LTFAPSCSITQTKDENLVSTFVLWPFSLNLFKRNSPINIKTFLIEIFSFSFQTFRLLFDASASQVYDCDVSRRTIRKSVEFCRFNTFVVNFSRNKSVGNRIGFSIDRHVFNDLVSSFSSSIFLVTVELKTLVVVLIVQKKKTKLK